MYLRESVLDRGCHHSLFEVPNKTQGVDNVSTNLEHNCRANVYITTLLDVEITMYMYMYIASYMYDILILKGKAIRLM